MHGEIMSALERTVRLASTYAKVPDGTTYEGWSGKFTSRTGELRSSIKTFVVGGITMGYVGSVVAYARHAAMVEYGTKPHVIAARRKKFLRFEVGGNVLFRRAVNHPGTFPRPFMRAAQLKAQPFFEDLIAEAFVRAFL